MAHKLGIECKLYYGAAGATANTLISNVRDVTLNLESDEVDLTTRASGGWKWIVQGLNDGSVEFEMVWDTADTAFTAVKSAWLNKTAMAFLILDREDGEGLDADFAVTKISRSEPLADAVKASVTIKPTYSTRAPAWHEASGS